MQFFSKAFHGGEGSKSIAIDLIFTLMHLVIQEYVTLNNLQANMKSKNFFINTKLPENHI